MIRAVEITVKVGVRISVLLSFESITEVEVPEDCPQRSDCKESWRLSESGDSLRGFYLFCNIDNFNCVTAFFYDTEKLFLPPDVSNHVTQTFSATVTPTEMHDVECALAFSILCFSTRDTRGLVTV
jgi:hypothetical protein